jgi:ABC-type lipoprotein release transport system permease subunit
VGASGGWLRAEARRDGRRWLFLALLVGLFGGAVLAAAAGARRTETSYHRFLAATKAPDLFLFQNRGEPDSPFADFSHQEVIALPEVARVGQVAAFSVASPSSVALLAPLDDHLGRDVLVHKVIRGRLPDPTSVDEASISFMLADALHLGVGDRLPLKLARADQTAAPEEVTFRIVGIEAEAGGFPPQSAAEASLQAWTTRKFASSHPSLFFDSGTALGLRHGPRDVAAVRAALTSMAHGKLLQLSALDDQSVNTQRSIHLQAIALWLLAGALALVVGLVLSQLLARQASDHRGDLAALHAIGFSPDQLWLVGVLRATAIGAAGAVVAVIVAAVASPIFPLGLARAAEPHPGFDLDIPALAVGAAATVLIVVLVAIWPAWRASRIVTPSGRASQRSPQPSGVARALERSAAPVPVATGVRFALDAGRGRSVTPVRSTIVAAGIGVAALTCAIVFSASLDHLLATPSLYGVSWDARVTTAAADDVSGARDALLHQTDVVAMAEGYDSAPLRINDVRVDAVALTQLKGSSLLPTVLEGRAPERAGEIMLGTVTLRQLHAHLGDRLSMTVAGAPDPVTVTVVGRGVFATVSDGMGLGRGASLTIEGLAAGVPGLKPDPGDLYLRFAPSIDPDVGRAHLARALGSSGAYAVTDPPVPADLVNFGRVRSLPTLLGGLLAAFAALTLAHLLLTTLRRHRHDFAILRAMGYTTGQTLGAVACQSATIALLALSVGLALGYMSGRWAWDVVARQLGVLARPATPYVALSAVCVGTLLLAAAIAALPAWRAARNRPAEILRSE